MLHSYARENMSVNGGKREEHSGILNPAWSFRTQEEPDGKDSL